MNILLTLPLKGPPWSIPASSTPNRDDYSSGSRRAMRSYLLCLLPNSFTNLTWMCPFHANVGNPPSPRYPSSRIYWRRTRMMRCDLCAAARLYLSKATKSRKTLSLVSNGIVCGINCKILSGIWSPWRNFSRNDVEEDEENVFDRLNIERKEFLALGSDTSSQWPSGQNGWRVSRSCICNRSRRAAWNDCAADALCWINEK